MRLPPLSIIAAFPKANYVNPELMGPALVIVNTIFTVLAVVAVGLRVYVRTFITRHLGKDDIMIILALISAVGLNLSSILANQFYGWDRHIWDVPFTMYGPSLKIAMASKMLFSFAATFTKISLILFYYRMIQDAQMKWYRSILHASLVVTISVGITFVLLTVFLCVPVRAYWTFPPLPNQRCLNEAPVTLAAGIINTIMDFWVTVLPTPMILQIQLPFKQKLGVLVLLCLGFVATIAGAIRTVLIKASFYDTWDLTYYGFYLLIAACVEINLALICASMPALKPMFKSMAAKVSTNLRSLRGTSTNPMSKEGGTFASKNARSQNRDPYSAPGTVTVTTEIHVDKDPQVTVTSHSPDSR